MGDYWDSFDCEIQCEEIQCEELEDDERVWPSLVDGR